MSTSSDDPPPGPEELRDDQLSRRYYIGGLIGLPWLWIVHAIHYYGKQRNEDAQRILRGEQHIADPSSELDTGNENAEKERMWVMRGRNSAIAVTCGWITWILFVQVIFPDSLPSSWYVRDPNSFAATGW
ncbi:hypothetical protein FRACYDRAFT_275537 [Fragilariopsis cylindrus CCMP1102]|uniref:Gamma-secretase subunit PEN-2 n=1 Tax=Fragilariopsis cylindrus CCMP1102 TaxID=635003 RepID=A0A1E7FAA5_9STRA|nr:hypothetical protein FRACYDRAFT_275537 [Fragilariopsis cylindrus CCMP1102]|eukprot:OEU15064.1 hypothetical protein FRACYDRAFT_275537 [Fragilariopsis cylindrus CCMP1102]